MLVLSIDTLEKLVSRYIDLMEIYDDFEHYIKKQGLPYLDYKIYRSPLFSISPIRKFRQGVRRIIRILKAYKADAPVDASNQSIIEDKMSPFRVRRRSLYPLSAAKVTGRKGIRSGIDKVNNLFRF